MTRVVPLCDAVDVARVGGKAASLGRLLRAGFDVPDGFVIETMRAGATDVCSQLADAITHAYEALGGTVAVRSSATAEDGAAGSMAGQFETILNVTGAAAVLDAVRHCLASAASDRVRAYAAEKGIDSSLLAMAVVVQRQVAADVAGVMFTASPDDAHPRQMLIDAAWGLGESVVSGRVQPDILRVAFDDGRVLTATIATKTTELTADGERAVPPDRQTRACLNSHDVHRLWQLGRAVEAHFGSPQDTEWAICDRRLHLLQSRPITTHADAAVRAKIIDDTRDTLRQRSAAGDGPWVLHNLAETLPHPSPLAWDVVRRFMSASGAYGNAYRSIGFAPADDLADYGFLDLIGGRIYMDAARAPRMFWPDFPFAYDADVLRQRPDASQQPPTRATGSAWKRFVAARRVGQVDRRLRDTGRNLESECRKLIEVMATFVADEKRVDLTALSGNALAGRWTSIENEVMCLFGRYEVLAGLAAGQALNDLQQSLAEYVWDEDPAALAQLLSSGGPADGSLTADTGLYEIGIGHCEIDTWLAAHGHRGVGEFDLASPRWRERPDAVRTAAARLAAAGSPAERHTRHAAEVDAKLDAICQRLSAADARVLNAHVSTARAAVVLREDAKDALMLGYDLLRDIALEAGRRLGVTDGVFELGRDELLAALDSGYAPVGVIETRRARRAAEERVRWPAFLDAAALDTLGNTKAAASHGPALAVSAGEASGPALVVRSPDEVGEVAPGYVLVCPSTDPSWTPLLVGAAAVVVECGGVLSHGAVVARELGVPAVVLPDATRRFATGEAIYVDGTRGIVVPADEADAMRSGAVVSPATLFTARVPPVGRRERRAWRVATLAASGWGLLLLLFFVFPVHVVRWPAFAVIDAVVWPMVRAAGWPLTVGLIAFVTAVVLLVVQRFGTDNHRLTVAKQRSAAAVKQGEHASGVAGRTLAASLVPTALLLGPLVILFVWLGERATPSAWVPPAGSAVRIAATVDGEWTGPLTLIAPPGITIDSTTPATQSLPALRPTLENLLTLYRRPRPAAAGEPWQVTVAPDPARQQAADDLAAFLKAGLPPQVIEWTLRPDAAFDGTFAVTVATPGHAAQTIKATVGRSHPPSPPQVDGPAGSPLRSLSIVKNKSIQPTPFVAVFGVDIGWVGVYVAVYVVVLLVLRRLLNVA